MEGAKTSKENVSDASNVVFNEDASLGNAGHDIDFVKHQLEDIGNVLDGVYDGRKTFKIS